VTRLIVIGPVPPPFHGVSVSTSLVLANRHLRERFAVEHLDTSDRRTVGNVGRWDTRNVVEALSALARLVPKLRGERGLVYLPISQGIPGLVRDTLLIRVASGAGWRVAAHLRGSELGGVYRRQYRPVRAWLRASLLRLDSIAVLGESLQDLLEGIVPASRIAVVPNGTPDPGHRDGASEGPLGVYLGNLYARKGALEALEAARIVVRERPDARFIFAGECPDPELRRRFDDAAVDAAGRIELRPPVTGEEKDRLLLSSGFLLFPPARQEGHPRVVLEALAAGLPVITTDRGVIAETVVDGTCGYVLPAPVPTDLAGCMLELVDDGARRERMGRAARARYLERFTEDAADRALAEWLERAVAGAFSDPVARGDAMHL
jgi:glycosyltransferase involved in cell wall biosynthesis